MKDWTKDSSPRLKARFAGVCYLITIGAGIFALFFVGNALIVRDDPAATASNILASESLFRLGFAADLIAGAAYVAVTAILYVLLRPVSRTLSLIAAFFSLVGIAIGAVNLVNYAAPLVFLGGTQYLATFTPDQLQALALTFLKLQGRGLNIGLIFFGFYCSLIGLLIFKSTFFPRILGVLMALAGASYLINGFAIILAPAFAAHLIPYIFAPILVGEVSLCLWLIVIGVNVSKWEKKAGAARSRS